MSTVRVKLFNTLEDLNEDQFKRFKFYVKDDCVLEGCSRIPGSRVERADRTDMVDLMVQQYEGNGALRITLNVLEKIGRRDLVECLRKSNPKGPGLGPTPSVPAPTPSVSAEQRLRSVRTEFISRASEPVLRHLLDVLLDCGVVTDAEMEHVAVIRNRAEKAREVVDTVRKKGEVACSAMIRALCEVDPWLSTQLKLT